MFLLKRPKGILFMLKVLTQQYTCDNDNLKPHIYVMYCIIENTLICLFIESIDIE